MSNELFNEIYQYAQALITSTEEHSTYLHNRIASYREALNYLDQVSLILLSDPKGKEDYEEMLQSVREWLEELITSAEIGIRANLKIAPTIGNLLLRKFETGTNQ